MPEVSCPIPSCARSYAMGDGPRRRRLRIDLKPAARLDISDIALYTFEHWGRTQRDRYKATLLRNIRNLATFPELGMERGHLTKRGRMLYVEEHVIYYRVDERVVTILRVLHVRQSPVGRLE